MTDKTEYLLKYVFGVIVILGSFYLQHEGKITDMVFSGIVVAAFGFITKMEYDQKQALKK